MQHNTNSLNHDEDVSLFSNAFGFLRQPVDFDPYGSDAEVVITGVPFDIATSGRSGTRFGPEGIRRASMNLAWEHRRYPWGFELQQYLKVIDCGDLVYSPGDAANMLDKLWAHADRTIAAGKKMLTLGGDHYITLPLLRAHNKHYGTMALVHFDAHSDTYQNGTEFDHGTMFYHAPLEKLIDPERSIQIGIRTEYSEEDKFTVIDGAMANDLSPDFISRKIIETIGDLPVYLTFDIDCLDPAYAPGTGTPVVGGLSTDRALKILRGLRDVNIIGMDVVEVSPPFDHSDITSLAGASIALELLYMLAFKKIKH